MGDNAAFKLAEILKRLEKRKPEIDTSQEIFAHLNSLLGRSSPITPENVDIVADEISLKNQQIGAGLRGLSRMTFTPTVIGGGVKSNSVPAFCTLVCDIRSLPHQDEAYVRNEIEKIIAGIEGVTYELIYTAIPNASPYKTEFADSVRSATQIVAGRDDIAWMPGLSTGFTDSRFVRPLGNVTYGFLPSHPDTDPKISGNAHGANESSDLDSLFFRTKFFIAVACDVLKAQSG
jgi:acetylornithine deacetylase/succinyl-diaminopimelate desuccinylase-like protein